MVCESILTVYLLQNSHSDLWDSKPDLFKFNFGFHPGLQTKVVEDQLCSSFKNWDTPQNIAFYCAWN